MYPLLSYWTEKVNNILTVYLNAKFNKVNKSVLAANAVLLLFTIQSEYQPLLITSLGHGLKITFVSFILDSSIWINTAPNWPS